MIQNGVYKRFQGRIKTSFKRRRIEKGEREENKLTKVIGLGYKKVIWGKENKLFLEALKIEYGRDKEFY